MRTIFIWALLLLSVNSVAREPGHYAPGVANVRDLTTPAETGFYYLQYNSFYTTDTYRDRNGDSVDAIGPLNVEADVDVFAVTPVFFWATDFEILGAKNSMYVAPGVARSSVNASLSSLNLTGEFDSDGTGLTDVFVQPLFLGWKNEKWDLNVGAGAYLPLGKYDEDDDDNIGLGFWTGQLQAASYFYFNEQATALLLGATYEFHGEKDGTDITPGDHFTLEYGVSQYLSPKLEVGIAGYSQWQVSSDDGRDALLDLDDELEFHGIGLQAAYWIAPRVNLSLKWMREYDAEVRFEGDWIMLNLTVVPSALF